VNSRAFEGQIEGSSGGARCPAWVNIPCRSAATGMAFAWRQGQGSPLVSRKRSLAVLSVFRGKALARGNCERVWWTVGHVMGSDLLKVAGDGEMLPMWR